MVFAKKVVGLIGSLVPLNVLFKYYWTDFIVLTYHSLSGFDAEPEVDRYINRTKSEFDEDLKYIKNNFNVLSLMDFLEIKNRDGKFRERSLLLTFDDGLAIQYDHMYPILKSYNIPATFFINNAFIDNRDLHYERKKYFILRRLDQLQDNSVERKISKAVSEDNIDNLNLKSFIHKLEYQSKNTLDIVADELGISFTDYLNENKIYLTTEQIETMLRNNMAIGGHSIDHPDFTELSLEDQVNQTLSSVNDLASRFRLDYKAFAFPYNDRALDTALFERIGDSIDASFGISGFIKDEFKMHFQRGRIEHSTLSPKQAMAAIFGKYYAQRLTGKHIIKRY